MRPSRATGPDPGSRGRGREFESSSSSNGSLKLDHGDLASPPEPTCRATPVIVREPKTVAYLRAELKDALNTGNYPANQPARLAQLDHGNYRAIVVQGDEGPAQVVRLGQSRHSIG